MPPTSAGFSARPRSQAAPAAAPGGGFSARPATRGNTNREIWRAPGWVWLLVGVASAVVGVTTGEIGFIILGVVAALGGLASR